MDCMWMQFISVNLQCAMSYGLPKGGMDCMWMRCMRLLQMNDIQMH